MLTIAVMSTTPFSLASLETANGPAAAIYLNDSYTLLALPLGLAPKETTVRMLLDDWDTLFPKLQKIASDIAGGSSQDFETIAGQDAKLLTPILYPDKLLAVGANYAEHLREMGLKVEKWASMPFFMRPPKTSLVGPGLTVRIPRSTKQFDWECELAIVVGKRLNHASREEAAAAIAGYSIGLDLSCRDLIPAGNDLQVDLMRGKAQDTMAPLGPHFVPAQVVSDPNNLRIMLDVNGRRMIDSNTSDMLYKPDEQLSVISEYITLVPGDVVFTGSPPGSASVHGGCWLQPGDRVRAEIQNIGVLGVEMRQD